MSADALARFRTSWHAIANQSYRASASGLTYEVAQVNGGWRWKGPIPKDLVWSRALESRETAMSAAERDFSKQVKAVAS